MTVYVWALVWMLAGQPEIEFHPSNGWLTALGVCAVLDVVIRLWMWGLSK
jgi:hypothetical protein